MPLECAARSGAAELKRARRRLRFVDAGNAGKILRHDRYWTAAFWQLYLQECRWLRLQEPSCAKAMARHAPTLVARVKRLGDSVEGQRPEFFLSQAESASAEVRSWALNADCLRLCGELDAARRALGRALEVAQGRRLSLLARCELQRTAALLELAAGRVERAVELLEWVADLLSDAVIRRDEIDDEYAMQFSETLLLLGCSPSWFEQSFAGMPRSVQRSGPGLGPAKELAKGPGAAKGPGSVEWPGSVKGPGSVKWPRAANGGVQLGWLGQSVAYSRPRHALGGALFDSALDLIDARLAGPRPSPTQLESLGRWLRRARRQRFKRGEGLRRLRLTWSEGRVLSLLGISRLAQRRLERTRDLIAARGDALRLGLVTLDLVMLDVGRDDRDSAARRLATARDSFDAAEDQQMDELLRQARRASLDSLQVFRRRLARRLEREPPAALVPRSPKSSTGAWTEPSLGGIA